MTPPAVTLRRRDSAPAALDDLPAWLSRVYAARRVTDPRDLDYRLAGLARPQDLSGLDTALEILEEAVQADARITFIGDFDADGATSCAVGVGALRAMGMRQVGYLVPNRFDFGYGLSPEIVGKAAAECEPDVLITVDNGIASHAGVLAARELGITTIITDHHLPGDTLPEADAIVNPNNPGDRFASKALAGVGVIYYVMLALRGRLRAAGWFGDHRPEPNLGAFLDLVALGTIADLVALDRNNRILVAQGLARIRAGRSRPGLVALLECAGRDPARLGSRDLGFSVAPRLNAAGRLEDMSVGIECLLSEDPARARALAAELDDINRKRREMQADMVRQAEAAVAGMTLDGAPPGIALYDDAWHQGLVGLIASRITELTQRPAIAFAPVGEQQLKGSARSVDGVHIRDVLAAIDVARGGLIERFGGHAMAAGLSIPRARLGEFQTLFAEQVARHAHGSLGETRVVLSDGALAEADISLASARLLQTHGPWGQGFPEPLFDDRFEVLERRTVGRGFVRYRLRQPGGRQVFTGICFGPPPAELEDHAPATIHAAYRLSENDYRGQQSVQLIIEHVLAADPPPDPGLAGARP